MCARAGVWLVGRNWAPGPGCVGGCDDGRARGRGRAGAGIFSSLWIRYLGPVSRLLAVLCLESTDGYSKEAPRGVQRVHLARWATRSAAAAQLRTVGYCFFPCPENDASCGHECLTNERGQWLSRGVS